MIKFSRSLKQTQNIAKQIAKEYKVGGGIVALIGNLGAGKTIFAQEFAKSLGIQDKIISPSFVLIRQHQIPDKRIFFHLDLYRIEYADDFTNIGINDLLKNKKNIVLIEWAEKIYDLLPKNSLVVKIEIDGDIRKFTVDRI